MNRLSNKLIRWLAVFTTLFMAVAPLGIPMLNYFFRIPALFVILLFVVNNFQKISTTHRIAILLFCLIFLFHFIADTDVNFNIFLSVISILSFLLLIAESHTVALTTYTIKILNRCSIISGLSLVVYAFSSISHRSIYEGFIIQSPYLTFGYDNSNYAGIVALLVFSAIYITQNRKSRLNRCVSLIFEFVLLMLIYQTNSRTAFISALFIPLMQFIFKKSRVPHWAFNMLLMLPFLFVPFYILLGNELGDTETVIMGKSIMTGRNVIYEKCLSSLSNAFYILLGNLRENPLQNAHNGPLAILVSTGVIGFLLYFYILFSVINRAYKRAYDFNSKAALFIILACLLNTSGEAALLLGGFPGITYVFMFYILSNSYVIEKKD